MPQRHGPDAFFNFPGTRGSVSEFFLYMLNLQVIICVFAFFTFFAASCLFDQRWHLTMEAVSLYSFNTVNTVVGLA